MHVAIKILLLISISFLINSNALSQDTSFIAEKPTNSPDRNFTGFEASNEIQPLWEIGLAGATFEVPNYPASSERNFIAGVLPYFVYRGDFFRVGDGGGVRAVFIEKSDFELDLSFSGAFSADTDDNTARTGMPELDYLFEVGPQLIYKIKDFNYDNGGQSRIKARFQARAVFSTDFDRLDDRGFVFEPTLTYQQRSVLFEETGLNLSLSFTFASEELQDYFYQVDNEFVRPSRQHFDAKGGYLGANFSVGFSFPLSNNIRGFVGGSIKIHKGAANQESPLFEKDVTYSIGAGLVWRLYESESKANW
jgi:outer membrane scaffolding protein for murein synthesis (MipA/OmpV family)